MSCFEGNAWKRYFLVNFTVTLNKKCTNNQTPKILPKVHYSSQNSWKPLQLTTIAHFWVPFTQTTEQYFPIPKPIELKKNPSKVHNSLPFDSQSERRTGNPSRDFQLCSGGSFQVHNHCALLTFCEGVSFFLPFSSDFFFGFPLFCFNYLIDQETTETFFFFLKWIWRGRFEGM